MKGIVYLALAVFCIFSLASEASAHGPSQFRGPRRVRRSQPFVQFNLPQRGHSNDFNAGFTAGVKAAQQQQFNRFQQFRGHHN